MAVKLMVVDDAPFIIEVFKQLFDAEAYDLVAEAANGQEAIERLKNTQPEVIIMDLVMPEKNGIEASREILEDYPHIKIIACSTLDDPDMKQRAFDAGCVAYLQKPFTKATVEAAIEQAVKQ